MKKKISAREIARRQRQRNRSKCIVQLDTLTEATVTCTPVGKRSFLLS